MPSPCMYYSHTLAGREHRNEYGGKVWNAAQSRRQSRGLRPVHMGAGKILWLGGLVFAPTTGNRATARRSLRVFRSTRKGSRWGGSTPTVTKPVSLTGPGEWRLKSVDAINRVRSGEGYAVWDNVPGIRVLQRARGRLPAPSGKQEDVP